MNENEREIFNILKEDRNQYLTDRNVLINQREVLRRNLNFMAVLGHCVDFEQVYNLARKDDTKAIRELFRNLPKSVTDGVFKV